MQFVMSKLGAGTALGGLISGAARKSQVLDEESKKEEARNSQMEQVLPGQADSASPPEASPSERKSGASAVIAESPKQE
jgi:hypothetical protein